MTDENSKLSKKRIAAVRPKLQERISASAGQQEIVPLALKMTGQTGNATIMDVARLAGVSKKTVSRVINNSELVQAPTRERVLDAVRQLNYVPDPQARGLSSKHAYLIGMVFDNPTAQYIVSMQYGILDGLRDSGFELVVHPCDSKQANYIEGILQFVKRQRLFGVILIPRVSEDEQLAEALREIGVEYIRIAAVPLEQADRMIVTNDRLAGIEVANYFESLGHRRVALINGPQRYRSAIERGAGFAEGLAARGLALEDRHSS
jgi:LacI family transcriptional regulator